MDLQKEENRRRAMSAPRGSPKDAASGTSESPVRVREGSEIDLTEQSFGSREHPTSDTAESGAVSFRRRAYKNETPHRYPWHRNSALGHLRSKFSLREMVSLSCDQVRFSPGFLEILGRQITDRNTIEAFALFMDTRTQLGKAYPHLLEDPAAPVFAARDGGPLLVSHRHLGLRGRGLARFVELRDELAEYLFRTRKELGVDQICSVTRKSFYQLLNTREKDPDRRSRLQATCLEYETVKAGLLSEIEELLKVVSGHSSSNTRSPLVKEIAQLEKLSNAATFSPEEKQRLSELKVIRAGLEEEERERERADLRHRARLAMPRRLKVDESGRDVLVEHPDEEPPKPSIVQVYVPHPSALFIGTDGGTMLGDGLGFPNT